MGASSIAQAAIKSLVNAGKISPALGSTLGSAAGGLGMVAAGFGQGGVGGGLEGALGGAMIGGAFGGPIGAAVGAIVGGLVDGIFGGQKDFKQKVADAMKAQQDHLPPSETFSFAMGQSMAQTLSTGAAQSGAGFSSFALAQNTPFWANSIIGPLTKKQREILAQEQAGLFSNQPFLGLPTTDPFVGQGPLGKFATGGSNAQPVVHMHFHLPGFVDANTAGPIFQQHAALLTQIVGKGLPNSSSGFGANVRRAAFLP